jgi:hypothetical protein
MKSTGYTSVGLITLFLLHATPTLAVDMSALPPAQTANGITYLSGGVGEPESTAMKEAGSRYDLMMTFARPDGAFLADVKVEVTDNQGNQLLDIVSGPILLMDLPDGSYTITAAHDGDKQVRNVDVGSDHSRLAYTWP